jgi:hypothetical protein
MPDPITGAGFDAPSPEVAYMGAPDMAVEAAELVGLQDRLRAQMEQRVAEGRQTDEYDEYDEHQARLYLLRRAALADRLSLDHPGNGEFLTEAAQLAHQLAKYDQEHDTHVGPIGPTAIEWDPSHRPYVRQEYDHWGW